MKALTISVAQKRKVIIFVGKGKSTLTKLITENPVYYGLNSVIKSEDKIKVMAQKSVVVIHLNKVEEYKLLPAGIKRRALMFEINF